MNEHGSINGSTGVWEESGRGSTGTEDVKSRKIPPSKGNELDYERRPIVVLL